MNFATRFISVRCLVPLFLLPFLLGAPRASAAAEPTVVRGLVVLVRFPDVQAAPERMMVVRRFNRQLDDYVRQMSYGRVSLVTDVRERWYEMPRPVTQYRISSRNLEVDHSRIRALIDDALAGVGGDIDLSRYSFVAILMAAGLRDYGMIGLCGYPGMLGWRDEDALRTKDGRTVRGGVAIFTYQAHLGTLFHDVAHVLGGVRDGRRMVPCLYDHDLQAKPGPLRETFEGSIVNMGFWDPMSCHYWRRDAPPPGISSWTKLRLGWLDDSRVAVVRNGEEAEVLLGPLQDASATTVAIRVPISPTRYYLIENRQPIGYDQNLPGSGVLILSADDDIAECRHGRAPVKLVDARPSVPRLEGAAFDAGEKNVFRDAANQVSVRIEEQVGGSYRVRVNRKPE
jgi:M6 family metalloprotease-like protein